MENQLRGYDDNPGGDDGGLYGAKYGCGGDERRMLCAVQMVNYTRPCGLHLGLDVDTGRKYATQVSGLSNWEKVVPLC